MARRADPPGPTGYPAFKALIVGIAKFLQASSTGTVKTSKVWEGGGGVSQRWIWLLARLCDQVDTTGSGADMPWVRSHRRRVPYGWFRSTFVRSYYRRPPVDVPVVPIVIAVAVVILLLIALTS